MSLLRKSKSYRPLSPRLDTAIRVTYCEKDGPFTLLAKIEL